MCEHGGLDGNCLRCKDATITRLEAEIAALRAENTILKALRDELFDRNVALRAEVERLKGILEDHGPDGHNATNAQFVALRARCEAAEAKIIQLNQIITTLQDNAND